MMKIVTELCSSTEAYYVNIFLCNVYIEIHI